MSCHQNAGQNDDIHTLRVWQNSIWEWEKQIKITFTKKCKSRLILGMFVTNQFRLWRVYPDGGWHDTCWLMGLWSTQAKVEGIVPKAAWHWGRDSSVVNDPLRELGCIPLNVDLPSAWSSVDGDLMFYPICTRALFLGTPADINEWINSPVALVTEYSCPWGPC